MTQVVATLDDYGRPAWLLVMVLGFILFWPIGLGILAYMIWSGRMGCARNGDFTRWQQRMSDKWDRNRGRWGRHGGPFASSGNDAFDEYREETLKRLEEEQREFREFLSRLRKAKDKHEFDQFMAERRSRPASGPETGPSAA